MHNDGPQDAGQPGRITLRIEKSVGLGTPHRGPFVRRKLDDFPRLTAGYRQLMRRLANPLLFGPPICDAYVELVEHVFTESEAEVAQHLGMRGRTARQVARAARRPVDAVAAVLDRLADEKHTIAADGPRDKRRYQLMPVLPGMFELLLIDRSPETFTPWHQRFAELFEALYETGYMADYARRPSALMRFVPAAGAIDGHPLALPSDRLEAVFDRYAVFGVGNCQCRMSARAVGRGCDYPLENCLVMGEWAERALAIKLVRRIDRAEALAIKQAAESAGLVNWLVNVESPRGQASCSCCPCCCKAMRVVTHFHAPAVMAPPRFMPRVDTQRCLGCGSCARRCPTGAIVVEGISADGREIRYTPIRCIGCGQCVLACAQRAIVMEPVGDQRRPYRSWLALMVSEGPSFFRTAWKIWRSRSV